MAYQMTEQHRERIRRSKLGNRSKLGLKDSPATRERKRAAWTPERRRAASERGLRFASDRAWRDMIARSVAGTLNPRFRGRDNGTGYAPGFGRLHRRLIRERAGNRCEMCQREIGFQRLDVHHRDRSKTNHHPDNLQALCRRCHKQVHPNPKRD